MTNLVALCNDTFNKNVLRKTLDDVLDNHLKKLCKVRNAAVWIDILEKLTKQEGFVPDTIIEGIAKQAVKKHGNTSDTPDLLFSAIHYAQHFNYKKLINNTVFEFVTGVPVTRELLTWAPQPDVIIRR